RDDDVGHARDGGKPRRWKYARWGVLLFVVGCGAVINTLGGVGKWGWNPSPKVARHDTSFVSGGRRIFVERFAPMPTGLAHLGIHTRHHPAILVLHSSAGMLGRGGANVRGWADAFAERGFVAYVVHYFDRTGDTRTDDAREDTIFPQWTSTLSDAISFARADVDVDSMRVDAFGISLGGYMALALGAADRRVSRLVILSGGFFDALAPEVRRLPPTLLLHGDADDIVPIARAHAVDSTLSRLGVPHALVVYPGGSHGLDDDLEPDAIKRSVLFLEASHAREGAVRALSGENHAGFPIPHHGS
ncbi:MAG: dienelactone hydrolase family protein, partial [Gemmatimonadaceae bacterium]